MIRERAGAAILLWLLGIQIPIIILLVLLWREHVQWLVAETGGRVVIADEYSGSQLAVSLAAIMGGALAAVTLLLVALGIRDRPFIRLTVDGAKSVCDDLHSPRRGMAHHRAMALVGRGGYISGRLRTKWAGLHTDEVFFRDTVHGFLALALASVLVVAFATSSISSAVSSAGRAISNVAGSPALYGHPGRRQSVVLLQRLLRGCRGRGAPVNRYTFAQGRQARW